MYILGISCFRRDSAASLIKDGELIAAVQEERFTRLKFDSSFPVNSINYCLKEAGIAMSDLEMAGVYSTGLLNRLRVRNILKRMGYRKKMAFFLSSGAYLASAFYPSCFQEAVILVNGTPKSGIIFGRGEDNAIRFLSTSNTNYHLGAFYSAITEYLGFRVNSEEYKVMGLAAYGKPKYHPIILRSKRKLFQTNSMSKMHLEILFGIQARSSNSEITQEHMDIASSVQLVIEEEILKITEGLYKAGISQNLCLAGYMALNCVANNKILRQGLFKNIWIQPAADEAGCAIGVGLLIWHKYFGNQRNRNNSDDLMKNAFLGPSFNEQEVESFLRHSNIPYKKVHYSDIPRLTAGLLAQDKVVGWFQGRSEFGPRSLGARSILADSRNLSMHDRLNLKVKFREPFRPLAPVVLTEKAGEYFDLGAESPYMLFVATVNPDKRNVIPAVTHVDNTSRIQTIKRDANPLYYDTIYEFYKITGCPVIINTSFNTKDEPIVLTPEDAYRCFKRSDIDCLVIESFLLTK